MSVVELCHFVCVQYISNSKDVVFGFEKFWNDQYKRPGKEKGALNFFGGYMLLRFQKKDPESRLCLKNGDLWSWNSFPKPLN